MPFWDTDYKKEAMKSKERREAAEQREAEAKQRAVAYRQKVNAVIVTTGDLKEDYEIIGPVYFQVSNKGMFSSTLSELVNKYSAEIEEMKNNALMSERRNWRVWETEAWTVEVQRRQRTLHLWFASWTASWTRAAIPETGMHGGTTMVATPTGGIRWDGMPERMATPMAASRTSCGN